MTTTTRKSVCYNSIEEIDDYMYEYYRSFKKENTTLTFLVQKNLSWSIHNLNEPLFKLRKLRSYNMFKPKNYIFKSQNA